MGTKEIARDRVIKALRQKGFSEREAGRMLKDTLKAVRENERECVEICQGLLGLEFEYISPLLQP